MYKPDLIPNILKNDLLFLLAGGFFALIPDLNKVGLISDKFHNSGWSNIFFGHNYLDKFPDTVPPLFVVAIIVSVILYFYWSRL